MNRIVRRQKRKHNKIGIRRVLYLANRYAHKGHTWYNWELFTRKYTFLDIERKKAMTALMEEIKEKMRGEGK